VGSGSLRDATDGTIRYEVNSWNPLPVEKPSDLKWFIAKFKQNMSSNDPLRWHSWFEDFAS